MWLSERARLLCVCQQLQTARRKPVCAGVALTPASTPATHARGGGGSLLLFHYSAFTENLSEAQQEERGGGQTNYQSDHQTGNKEARQSFIMETMEEKKKRVLGEATAPLTFQLL